MLTNWIVCLAATSFLLGFMKPMFSPQAHAIISMGAYLGMWFVLRIYEKRTKPTYSNAPYVIFGLVVVIGALSLLSTFVPSVSEPTLFVRALVFLAALVYLFSSTVRMYVDVWLGRLKKG